MTAEQKAEERRVVAAIEEGIARRGFHVLGSDYFEPHIGPLAAREGRNTLQRFAKEFGWEMELNEGSTLAVFYPRSAVRS